MQRTRLFFVAKYVLAQRLVVGAEVTWTRTWWHPASDPNNAGDLKKILEEERDMDRRRIRPRDDSIREGTAGVILEVAENTNRRQT